MTECVNECPSASSILIQHALCSLRRLFQNIALGEWMDAMEHDGVARSTASFRTYMLSVGVVLLATMFRAVTQVTSNLISAQVSRVCYLLYFKLDQRFIGTYLHL